MPPSSQLGRPDAAETQALAAARAVLQHFGEVATIFDAIEVVVYVADMQSHELLFVNSHAARLWGGELVGKRCFEALQSGQKGPCAFCTNPRLTQDGKAGSPVVWEFQNTLNGRWYLCIDKAIPWVDGRLVRMEVAIDITQRKAIESFHQQYVSLISHDLRNPLSALTVRASGLMRALRRKGLESEAQSVEPILESARRIERMLSDLVETTQLESVELQLHRRQMDLAELAGRVVARVGPGDGATGLEVHAPAPVPVLGDPDRLESVLENLLANAFRYSPSGAPVRVEAERRGDEAVVSVIDHGMGISPEELPQLFQRFFRAKAAKPVKGLGLGLYNSRLIIERHGGRIWAESELGKGSVFRFSLPCAAPEAVRTH